MRDVEARGGKGRWNKQNKDRVYGRRTYVKR